MAGEFPYKPPPDSPSRCTKVSAKSTHWESRVVSSKSQDKRARTLPPPTRALVTLAPLARAFGAPGSPSSGRNSRLEKSAVAAAERQNKEFKKARAAPDPQVHPCCGTFFPLCCLSRQICSNPKTDSHLLAGSLTRGPLRALGPLLIPLHRPLFDVL